MKPLPVGSRIRVTGNSNSHDYQIGSIYRVHEDDHDGTFRAIDGNGTVGKYIKWTDCEGASIGWEWLRTQLDARSLDLLGAFEGVEQLSLKREIENKLVLSIPHLDEAVLGILPGIEEQAGRHALNCAGEDDGIDSELDDIFGQP
jgi:hypothetical protein